MNEQTTTHMHVCIYICSAYAHVQTYSNVQNNFWNMGWHTVRTWFSLHGQKRNSGHCINNQQFSVASGFQFTKPSPRHFPHTNLKYVLTNIFFFRKMFFVLLLFCTLTYTQHHSLYSTVDVLEGRPQGRVIIPTVDQQMIQGKRTLLRQLQPLTHLNATNHIVILNTLKWLHASH